MNAGRFNSWMGRLGGSHAFDGYVWILFLAACAWVTIFIDFGREGRQLEIWALAGTISALASLAWMALGRAVWLRLRNRIGRGSLVAAVYLTIGLIRNGTLSVACLSLGLTPPNGRIISSGLATLLLLSLANQTAARRIASQNIERDLLRERQKLIWLSATYDEKVSQEQRSLDQQIEAEVFPALRTAVEKLDLQDTAEAADLASYLTDTVNTVVRPLSEKLAKNTEPILERLDEISDDTTGLRSGIRYSIRDALRPTATVGALLVVGLALSPALGKSGNFVGYALACAVAFVSLTTAKFAWPKRFDSLSRPAAAATIVAIYLLVFAASETAAIGAPSLSPISLIQFSFGIGGALILTRLVLLEQASREAQKLLAQQNDSLARLISGLRKQIWLARRNTAWVLHGPIQSALTSAAMALGASSNQFRDRKGIRDSIAAALDALDSSSSVPLNASEALHDIVKVWQRTCNVHIAMGDDATAALASDADSAFCVIEIVREAVSNAVRHGGARNVFSQIKLTNDGLISVTVDNDGSQLPMSEDVGLGSAMLDQITHQWVRENLSNGVRLSALVVPERTE